MKKVIIISPAYPLRGGIAESTELLYREYIKKGFSCKIISYKLQYPNFFFPGKSQVINLNKKKEGLNILSKLNSINPISWFFVARFISMQNPDYVIFRYSVAPTGNSPDQSDDPSDTCPSKKKIQHKY